MKPVAWMLECVMNGSCDTGWLLSWSRSGAGLCNRLTGAEHEKPLVEYTTELQELLESVSSWCEKVNDVKLSKASVGDTMKAMDRLYLASKQFIKSQNNKEEY